MRATIAIDLRTASPRNLKKQTFHWQMVVSMHEGQSAATSKRVGNLPIHPRAGRGLSISNRRFRTRRLVGLQEGRAVNRASQALRLRGYSSVRQPEPFGSVIRCTSDSAKVDDLTRSKWSRCCGTRRNSRIRTNRCVILSSAKVESTNARRGLPGALGEVGKVALGRRHDVIRESSECDRTTRTLDTEMRTAQRPS